MRLSSVVQSTVLFLAFIPSHLNKSGDEVPATSSYSQSESLQVKNLNIKLKNQFHENIFEKLEGLAKEYKFFKLALNAINKKDYEFFLYSKDDKSIPKDVHECINEVSCLAMTFKDRKKVYFKEELFLDGREKELLGALTNEALHIILDPTDTVEEASEVFGRDTNSEEIKDETKLFKAGEETASEEIFHHVLNEEVLSQVVEDIILEKSQNKDYMLTEENLRDGSYSGRLLQIKSELSIPVFARIFDINQFEEKDYPFILEKVNGYSASGKIEDYLIEKLKEFELLD